MYIKYYWDTNNRDNYEEIEVSDNATEDEIQTRIDEYVQNKEIIESLIILANGCKTHSSYRAKRKVITWCETCNKMWDVRQELINRYKILL